MPALVLVLTGVCSPIGAVHASAAQAPATDTQWWQQFDLAGTLSEHLAYLISGFSRFSDNDPNPALTGAGALVSWKQGALSYTLGYIHAQIRSPSNGSRLNADLPLAAIAGTIQKATFAVTDQFRLEDVYGVPGNPWRYRNLLAVSDSMPSLRPLGLVTISDEIFVDLHSGQLTRNRLLAGPQFELTRHSGVTLDYVNERDVDKRPGRIRGALIDWTVRF